MSNVAKLKKQAAEFELKKQFDKALAIYVKLLDNFDENAAELDVALFNRVGDLQLKQGNVADAVDFYERAIDRYADGGFFNNAIALCNKILRHSPGRSSVYYKLGKISAQKGFKSDAKQNFLEYAERMQKSGNTDEAFRALAEFADLCPDQDDIRLMLADQLTKAGRKADAVEQLQTLYERYDGEGRAGEATATLDRLRAIDPAIQPRAGGARRRTAQDELVFLDLGEAPRRRSSAIQAPIEVEAHSAAPVPVAVPPERIVDIEKTSLTVDLSADSIPPTSRPVENITRVDDGAADLDEAATSAGGLLGLESTNLGFDAPAAGSGSLLDIEPTSFGEVALPPLDESLARNEPPPIARGPEPEVGGTTNSTLEFILPDEMDTPLPPATPLAMPMATPAADDGLLDLSIDLGTVPSAEPPSRSTVPTPVSGAELASSDLPFLELDSSGDTETELAADLDFEIPMGPPPRPSTLVAAHSVEILRAAVEGEPEDWGLRRELAETMLDAGDRAGGIAALEAAMAGAERGTDLALAASLAEELARLEPESVRHHQKRVEYAFRRNDRGRLIEAYLALGDALVRADQGDKARTVYQHVLDLAPDDARALASIESLGLPAEPPPPPPDRSRSSGSARRSSPVSPVKPVEATPAASDFVNLGDWLRDDEEPRDTRMVVAENNPTGDEDADFADMLQRFKRGVAENVEAEDYQSHYDLAIAFKEMGLLDEAVHEFQKALASPVNRLATYEALGQCFIDKGQPKMAASILQRAVSESGKTDETLVGVLYLLGRAAESQGRIEDAVDYYQRVLVIDIQFRDVAERITEVERTAR